MTNWVMKLDRYRKQLGLSRNELAARLGVCTTAIDKWHRGERVPSHQMMLRIIKVTEGAVMPNDFFPPFEAMEK